LIINARLYGIATFPVKNRLFIIGFETFVCMEIFSRYPFAFNLAENAMIAASYDDGTRYLIDSGEKWKILNKEHFDNYGSIELNLHIGEIKNLTFYYLKTD